MAHPGAVLTAVKNIARQEARYPVADGGEIKGPGKPRHPIRGIPTVRWRLE